MQELIETQEFLTWKRISASCIESIPKALLSQASGICYFLMIFNMIHNAGLISLPYPFAVFGYALMEEGRPKKWFWNAAGGYTVFVLIMKWLINLDFWFLIGIESTYYSVNVSYY